MERPRLQDFHITTEEYELYESSPVSLFSNTGRRIPSDYAKLESNVLGGLACIVFLLAVSILADSYSIFRLLTILACAVLSAGICRFAINRVVEHKKRLLLKSDVPVRIKSYEKAIDKYYRWIRRQEQKQREEQLRQEEKRQRAEAAERSRLLKATNYWKSLNGIEFERELALLFKHLGYQVELTPQSGDHGVDLVLREKDKVTIVQCKRYSYPAGPAFARELLGAVVYYRADYGILACTGGFTQGVHEFVRNQPLSLMTVQDIVQLAERVEFTPETIRVHQQSTPLVPMQNTIPLCPICRTTMVSRQGKYGLFWGCSRWPKCRGARDFVYQTPGRGDQGSKSKQIAASSGHYKP